MKIAQQLKEKNIAEYLIYMWQVEDLLRANGCDIDRIRQNIICAIRRRNGLRWKNGMETWQI